MESMTDHNLWVFCSIEVQERTWFGQEVIALFINDVTEKTQEKIDGIQNNERHEQRRHAESFKATVSHELRTPVKMCISFLQDLIKTLKRIFDGDKSMDQTFWVLEMILSQLTLIECFVEDILNYNMLQEGAFKLKDVNFDPVQVLDFIKSTFA